MKTPSGTCELIMKKNYACHQKLGEEKVSKALVENCLFNSFAHLLIVSFVICYFVILSDK
jgi:hypothetical protein